MPDSPGHPGGSNLLRKPAVAVLLGAVALTILACGPGPASTPGSLPGPPATLATFTPRPTAAPTPPAATHTARPAAVPTSTPSPSATPAPTSAPACFLPPQEPLGSAGPLSDVILYLGPESGTGAAAYADTAGLLSPARGGGHAGVEQLWAISPDGRRTGRLTDDRAGIGYLALPGPPPGLLLLSADPLPLSAGPVRQVTLPAACQQPAGGGTGDDWLPCSDFRLSADGRWAAFLRGEDICGRGLVLLDLATGQSELLPGGHSTALFRFLPSGRLLLTRGHCEGADIYLRDPASGTEAALGGWGREAWRADGTALAVVAGAYMGWQSSVWGLDLETERRFLSPAGAPALDDLPLWTPDGTHLLYQHRALTYTASAWPLPATFGSREIRLVDARLGQERVLLADPGHDYHLGLGPNDCPWNGDDWLPLRRVPYRPQAYPSVEDADFSAPTIRCLLYGEACADPVELLVLNWRTGEIVPAGQFQVPTPLPPPPPTPTRPPAPDLGAAPLYSDPAGRYALYTGSGGQGLWCVPAGAEPVPWVHDGHHFVYIP